jgi:hypothetical protein
MKLPALLIAASLLMACATDPRVFTGNTPGGKPMPSPNIQGTITQVSPQVPPGDVQGTVLVEEQPGTASGGQKIVFRVRGNSDLLRRLAGSDQRINFNELRVGQVVQGWAAGPIAESYPSQADAQSILVISGP